MTDPTNYCPLCEEYANEIERLKDELEGWKSGFGSPDLGQAIRTWIDTVESEARLAFENEEAEHEIERLKAEIIGSAEIITKYSDFLAGKKATCETCKWWRRQYTSPDNGRSSGHCGYGPTSYIEYCREDFGCIHHEKRDGAE